MRQTGTADTRRPAGGVETTPPAGESGPYIGRPLKRVEDDALLRGRARFLDDLREPGQLRLYFVRSDAARARITAIRTSAALAVPGVVDVWTGPRFAALTPGMTIEPAAAGARLTTQPLLASDVVCYAGEPVAAILAEDLAIAKDAADLIEVDYDWADPVLELDAALRGEGPANPGVPDNILASHVHTSGGLGRGDALRTVSGEFTTARCSAAPMEPRGCLAIYDEAMGGIVLWDSTQFPHVVRTSIADILGFPENRVEVIAPAVGGGFGQKSHVFTEEVVACLLAMELRRPVRWVEERTENLIVATHAKAQRNRVELAYTDSGRIVSARMKSVTDAGAYNVYPWGPQIESMTACATLTGAYRIPEAHAEYVCVSTNKCPIGAYRGVGWSASQVAREALVDDIARQLGLTPFEIRRRNVIRQEDAPFTTPTGLVYREAHFVTAIDVLEQVVDYPAFLERKRAALGTRKRLGLGISLFTEMTGLGTAACRALGYTSACYDGVTVEVDPSGSVTVSSPFVSQGQGHTTTFAQVTADALGTTPDAVRIAAGSSRTAYGMGTWGSRAIVLASGALRLAAADLRSKLIAAAARLLEASEADIQLKDGFAHVAGTPSKRVSMRDMANAIYFSTDHGPVDDGRRLESTKLYDAVDVPFGMGAHAATVEVDLDTGRVDVVAVHAVEDCGAMVNPPIVEGQIMGGVAQGIGQALHERIVYDSSGTVVSPSLGDYGVPTASEIPEIVIHHLEHPSADGTLGIKGAGESTMISIPAAVLNAVNDALDSFGVRFRELPILPEHVVRAVHGW